MFNRAAAFTSDNAPLQEALNLVGHDLLSTPWVARLGGVSFLGTLDVQADSRGPSTRLEHSLGVLEMGWVVSEGFDLQERRTFLAACLLHDVGHYPLSHSCESEFAKLMGMNHHDLGRAIITGERCPAWLSPIDAVLHSLDLNPQDIWRLISSEARCGLFSGLLTAPINLDTLEAIRRTSRQFGLDSPLPPLDRIFVWRAAVPHLAPEAMASCDQFWKHKGWIYENVIHRRSNLLLEGRLQKLVRDSDINLEAHPPAEWTDSVVSDLMTEATHFPVVAATHPDMTYIARNYTVDVRYTKGQGVPLPELSHRYILTKQPRRIIEAP